MVVDTLRTARTSLEEGSGGLKPEIHLQGLVEILNAYLASSPTRDMEQSTSFTGHQSIYPLLTTII